ncbi:hypothetical protein JXA40_11325 [bacterium]|nr:hypothetical protein [candidate division CSSED10-310 bacterium]
MSRRIGLFIMLIAAGGILFGCSSRDRRPAETEAFIHLDVSPGAEMPAESDRVQGNSLLNIAYSWTIGPEYNSPESPLLAKVHFLNSDGEILWQDDHAPEPGTTEWKAGQIYRYERIVYVPLIPRISQITMVMGLYGAGENRYSLNGTAYRKDKYPIGVFTVSPPRKPEDLPEAKIEFLEGWYSAERNIATKDSWRWMKNRGLCRLKNPHREATLYLQGWVPTDIYTKPSALILNINGVEYKQYRNLNYKFEIMETIPTDLFEESESLALELITDHSYVPAERELGLDPRHLALMFKRVYFN